MRRLVFTLVGSLELAAAIVLAVLAGQLPGRAEVDDTVSRVEKVSRNAGRQVRHLRGQLEVARQRQPELVRLARALERQMHSVGGVVRSQHLGGDGLEGVSRALGEVARGLDGLSELLDPRGIAQIGKGLGVTADYLDGKVLPAAEKAATALDRAGAAVKADGQRLRDALAQTPLELKAARASADSLARFEEGLERMGRLARVENLEAMREGFKGMESSLDTGADQVEKVSNYTIPKVTVNGLKISVEQKDFWPEGKTIAEGMRKAARGCKAAGKELEAVHRELPRLRESLEQGRKVVAATRQALETALAQEEKLAPVLEALPRNLARLSEELPQMTAELARVLRETGRLKEVATALRQAEKGVEGVRARWPAIRDGLGKSADLLRATRKQLDSVVTYRDDHEATVRQAVELTELFAGSLPELLTQMEASLAQQERSLDDLGDSIDGVTETLPMAATSASRVLRTAWWLLILIALAVALHGGYQLVNTWVAMTPRGA